MEASLPKTVLVVGLITILWFAAVPPLARAQSSSSASSASATLCDLRYEATKLPSVNLASVLSLIESSARFQSLTSGLSLKLDGLAYDSHDDTSDCVLTPYSVDATFIVSSSNGTEKSVVASVDVGLTHLINITIESAFSASSNNPQATWSGYELYYPSGSGNYEQLEATIDFTQPTIDFPNNHGTSQPGCASPACNMVIWSGLTTNPSDNCNGSACTMLQGGSDAEAYINQGGRHVIYYQMWYEEVPSGPVYCSLNDMSSGHAIEAYVYSATLVGGSSGQWYIIVDDHTNGNTCSPTNPISNSFVPYFAELTLERPCSLPFLGQCYGLFSLPYFSQYGQQGRLYYNGAVTGANVPYNAGYYNHEIMQVNGQNLITNTAITQGSPNWGTFTNTWVTSQGT